MCCGCSRGSGCYFSSCWRFISSSSSGGGGTCCCSGKAIQHCGCIVIAQICLGSYYVVDTFEENDLPCEYFLTIFSPPVNGLESISRTLVRMEEQ